MEYDRANLKTDLASPSNTSSHDSDSDYIPNGRQINLGFSAELFIANERVIDIPNGGIVCMKQKRWQRLKADVGR